MTDAYLLGLDIGSGFVKAALVDARTRQVVAAAQSPAAEMAVAAPQRGWAEQDPRMWWEHCSDAVQSLGPEAQDKLARVAAVGIAYQMHGLVLLDAAGEPLRPAIIWCDGRSTQVGADAMRELGREWCLEHLCNLPGNFTAAKLGWVKRHEPQTYARARHAMLPGDYIALKLTGAAHTTPGGLSEMVLWHYTQQRLAHEVLDCLGLDAALLPPVVPAFGDQGRLTADAAARLGLTPGTPVTYRAGDQPNTAVALGALDPGAAAATAGTSGVVFAVTERACADPQQRVNTFLHANHAPGAARTGVLLCVNGAGSGYRWLRTTLSLAAAPSYQTLSALAEQAPPGADGLAFLPFGNGAERLFGDRSLGASLHGLDFNRHGPPHLARAVQEGVAFAMAYGLETLRALGLDVSRLRAGAANMFLSDVFSRAVAAACAVAIELRRTDGAAGAALAAGHGAGLYPTLHDAVGHGARAIVEAGAGERREYDAPYARWRELLARALAQEQDHD